LQGGGSRDALSQSYTVLVADLVNRNRQHFHACCERCETGQRRGGFPTSVLPPKRARVPPLLSSASCHEAKTQPISCTQARIPASQPQSPQNFDNQKTTINIHQSKYASPPLLPTKNQEQPYVALLPTFPTFTAPRIHPKSDSTKSCLIPRHSGLSPFFTPKKPPMAGSVPIFSPPKSSLQWGLSLFFSRCSPYCSLVFAQFIFAMLNMMRIRPTARASPPSWKFANFSSSHFPLASPPILILLNITLLLRITWHLLHLPFPKSWPTPASHLLKTFRKTSA